VLNSSCSVVFADFVLQDWAALHEEQGLSYFLVQTVFKAAVASFPASLPSQDLAALHEQ
jgi:hypothetical protein